MYTFPVWEPGDTKKVYLREGQSYCIHVWVKTVMSGGVKQIYSVPVGPYIIKAHLLKLFSGAEKFSLQYKQALS